MLKKWNFPVTLSIKDEWVVKRLKFGNYCTGFKLNVIKWSAKIVKPVEEHPQWFSATSWDF